jgi:hypothetical protein
MLSKVKCFYNEKYENGNLKGLIVLFSGSMVLVNLVITWEFSVELEKTTVGRGWRQNKEFKLLQ